MTTKEIREAMEERAENSDPVGFFFFFFFFLFWLPLGHMEFLVQGSNPSCRVNLQSSCGKAGSLGWDVGLGMEPASLSSRDAAVPFAPHQELQPWGLVCHREDLEGSRGGAV